MLLIEFEYGLFAISASWGSFDIIVWVNYKLGLEELVNFNNRLSELFLFLQVWNYKLFGFYRSYDI